MSQLSLFGAVVGSVLFILMGRPPLEAAIGRLKQRLRLRRFQMGRDGTTKG